MNTDIQGYLLKTFIKETFTEVQLLFSNQVYTLRINEDQKIGGSEIQIPFIFHAAYQKKCSQKVEISGSASLLCSGDTPPVVLHLALGHLEQERHQPLITSPEKGHKDNERNGSLFLEGKAGIMRIVQPGERKALG